MAWWPLANLILAWWPLANLILHAQRRPLARPLALLMAGPLAIAVVLRNALLPSAVAVWVRRMRTSLGTQLAPIGTGGL